MRILLIVISLCFCCFVQAQQDIRKQWQNELISVPDGGHVILGEGVFFLDATLSIEGKKNVTIRGKGPDKTIISFKNQQTGAEGLRVSNCSNIILEDFRVEDAKGDGIKTMNVIGITFRNVHAVWTGKPDKKNGAYALYPVLCENVLIEHCVARGASDAGIYVGQSKNIVVRNNKAFENVAGIEIENSLYAEVYENESYNNTGGILVFDLPDLKLKRGGYCKLYRNIVRDNNLPNFAPKGNIVAKVPLGTGILLLACNQVEVFENQLLNNRTAQTGIFSYYISENPIKDSSYYPYPTGINIHDNTYSKPRKKATMRGRMGKLYRFKLKFGKDVPDIVYDGILDKNLLTDAGVYQDKHRICIRNNTGASFASLDAANNFKKISRDSGSVDCSLSPLVFVQK